MIHDPRSCWHLSVIDGAFASMIMLLSAVNESIGASFVGAFENDKVNVQC